MSRQQSNMNIKFCVKTKITRLWPNFSVKWTFAVKIQVMFSYKILNINFNLVGISKQGFKHKL